MAKKVAIIGISIAGYLGSLADVYSDAEITELGITEEKDLGKTGKSVYEKVNQLLIDELENGKAPWRKPWDNGLDTAIALFSNYRTKRGYTGINPWLISLRLKPHHCPYFLTKAQIEKRGGKLNKDAIPFQVVYFGSAVKKLVVEPTPEKPNGDVLSRLIRFLKEYTVYNLADTDIELKTPAQKTEKEKIEACEAIYPNMPKKPELKHGGNQAFYSPGRDFVQMPTYASFKRPQEYYCTFFHELIHSTGHPKRLKREMGATFGDNKYAFEELIAEIGATYLCAHTGILFKTRINSGAYLRSWLKGLAKEAKENKTFFFKAASQSQKAANFIISKQLKAKKKKESLKGYKTKIYQKTNIALLKKKAEKLAGLGRINLTRRKFEPETLTDHVAEFLLGRRIKADSFARFGDSNHLKGKSGNLYRLHWLGNKGFTKERPLDQLAQDFMSEYGWYSNLDEMDIINEMVDIITNYPTGAGAYMDQRNLVKLHDSERHQEHQEHLEKQAKKKVPKNVATKGRKNKVVATKKILSEELSLIRRFVLLDRKQVSLQTLNEFLNKAKAQTSDIVNKIASKLEKAIEYANDSFEKKVIINLESTFKEECREAISKARIVTKVEFLAGSNPTEKEKFEPFYSQFSDKPKKAIQHLLKVKQGTCTNVFYREEVGYIDLPYGENNSRNQGFGLKHIKEKHGEEIARLGFSLSDFLTVCINQGLYKISKTKQRIVLESTMFRIVLDKYNDKAFLLSAFDLSRKALKGINGTIDGIDFTRRPLYAKTDTKVPKRLGKANRLTKRPKVNRAK